MSRHNLTTGEYVALLIGAGVGLLVFLALGAAGFAFPIAALVGWLVMVPIEYGLTAVERAVPDVVQTKAELSADLPLRQLFGAMSLVAPAVCLAGLVSVTFPTFLQALPWPPVPVLEDALTVCAAVMTFAAVGVGLHRLGSRKARIRIDALERKLTVVQPAGRRTELHISEVQSVRHERGTLFVEHAGGVELLVVTQVEWDQLEWLARELNNFAHELGADPEARKNRLKAQRALAQAKPADQ